MTNYQLEKAGRRLKNSVKLLNMLNKRNQRLASTIEFTVWNEAFRSEKDDAYDRPVNSEDIKAAYLMAAVEFSERGSERKTEFDDIKTVQTDEIRFLVNFCIDDMLKKKIMEEKEVLPLLCTLISSVERNIKKHGFNGYLDVVAAPFRPYLGDTSDLEGNQE